MTDFNSHAGSFRDPAGFIFNYKNEVYRQVNIAGKADFDFFISSGLYDALAEEGLLVKHQEVKQLSAIPASDLRYKIIKPEQIPFVTYPYEWSFSQLKAAALLTLRIQEMALGRGMILKDASAYNVQFIGQRPVFIDTLSFRVYQAGAPWDGYKQFCQHFIAPLALSAYYSPEIIKTLRVFLDGIPVALAARLLPSRSRLRLGIMAHIHLHAATQKRYERSNLQADVKTRAVSPTAMNGLLSSLRRSITSIKMPKQKTEWGEYYGNTNYSKTSFSQKQKIVDELLGKITPKPKIVWDLGANDATFSEIAARHGAYTVAFDVDYQAVESGLRRLKARNDGAKILPLVQDFSNPSPSLGWAHKERTSLEGRGPADAALALALIHHLAIGNNTPLPDIAAYFKSIATNLIIEFVPRSDSKVQVLLRGRNNIFADYNEVNFEMAFSKHFSLVRKSPVSGSKRVIYLYKAKV